MKTILFVLLVSQISFSADFTDCRVVKTTKNRLMNEIIPAGSQAVTANQDPITMDMILADEMIYFINPEGVMLEGYQWMYNVIIPIGNTNKYVSPTSFGEDVIITVDDPQDGLTRIHYNGMSSGNYLTLDCK